MKIKPLLMMFIAMNVCADNSMIELLEANGVSTEELVITEATHSLSGEETKVAVTNLIKQELFTQYSITNHESEKGQCLKQKIIELLNEPLDPKEPIDCIFPHHLYVDPPFVDRNTLSAVTNVKALAAEMCIQQQSSIMSFPEFHGPLDLVNLINVIDHFNNHSSGHSHSNGRQSYAPYSLSDGVLFTCNSLSSAGGN